MRNVMSYMRCSCDTVDELSVPFTFPFGQLSTPPAPWWNHSDDIDLLHGICIYGWGQWNSMMQSDLLRFKSKIGTMVTVVGSSYIDIVGWMV